MREPPDAKLTRFRGIWLRQNGILNVQRMALRFFRDNPGEIEAQVNILRVLNEMADAAHQEIVEFEESIMMEKEDVRRP